MMERQPIPGIVVNQSETDYRHFYCTIEGPAGSPFEGGEFPIEIFCPQDYPIGIPKCLIRCKIYHPNFNNVGQICLSILKPKVDPKTGKVNDSPWTPALRLSKVLLSLQVLLSEPNLDDPLDETINDHWKSDLEGAKEKAREWTRLYAAPQE